VAPNTSHSPRHGRGGRPSDATAVDACPWGICVMRGRNPQHRWFGIGDRVARPPPLADDEALIAVRAAGVANWNEIVRQGEWDVGIASDGVGRRGSGLVTAVGAAVHDWAPGDAVLTHPLPLHAGGAWAPQLIAPAGLLAPKPAAMSWAAAAAFPWRH
jgi:NADPH:quinone reductase-like Zn-dependent oxidoreductase